MILKFLALQGVPYNDISRLRFKTAHITDQTDLPQLPLITTLPKPVAHKQKHCTTQQLFL
jgi:hypothetical protein